MKVTLSGYNIDVLNDRVKTPETISAAYARISRSEKSLLDLRKEAIDDVGKARESNTNIVFNMGHSSVAEHAVFNFDIEDISRLAVEELEHHRLISVTEKSQRYVKFEDNYYIPKNLKTKKDIKNYKKICGSYFSLYEKLLKNSNILKEDARYVLPLATFTSLGLTVNARELEYIIRRLSCSKYLECNELAQKLFTCVKEVAPSLVKYTAAKINSDIQEMYLPDNDKWIGPLHSTYFTRLENHLNVLKEMNFWDKLPRSYEVIDIMYSGIISSCAFSQLKRHRFISLFYGRIYSDFILPKNLDTNFFNVENIWRKKNEYFRNGALGVNEDYLKINASKYKVHVKTNFRELVHIARLRLDKSAQWEIRKFVKDICNFVEDKYPWTAMFLCGKDTFDQTKKYFLEKYLE